jgi:ABC-type multidrug transport system fused ATPase/permease subunit
MARPANAPPSESAKAATAAAPAGDPQGLTKLVLTMIRPYRKWLVIVFAAMMVEAAMSLAGPWPLKIVIDNVVGDHKLPAWLAWMKDLPLGHDRMALAAAAALAVMLIAVFGAIAGYIDNYYTESVAQ